MQTIVKKYYLPSLIIYLLLALIYFGRITTVIGSAVTYDETVVYNISKQQVIQLLETVTSEPHPPTFYLLTKLIDTGSISSTRTIMALISIFLIAITNVVHYKTIKKLDLELPLICFFVSYISLNSITTLKQDAISIPIFISTFFVIIANVSENKASIKFLINIVLHLVILLLFGYLYFISALILFISLTIHKVIYKSNYNNFKALFVLTIIIIYYFVVYGKTQLISNIGRFSWSNEFPQSIVHIMLSSARAMNDRLGLAEDAVLIIIIFTIGMLVANIHKVKTQGYFVVIYIAGLINLAALILVNGLVRERYATAIWLYALIITGKTLSTINTKYTSYIQTTLLLLLVYTGLVSLANNQSLIQTYFSKHKNAFEYVLQNNLVQNENVGFITLSPTSAIVYSKEQLSAYKQFIPVNFMLKDSTNVEVTKELLKLDGNTSSITDENFYRVTKELKVDKFIYFLYRDFSYFDRSDSIFKTLSAHCENAIFVRDGSEIYDFVFFSDCN